VEGRRCGRMKNRARYDRDELRYPSDVTDAEWALIEPLIPAAKRGGRRRKTDMRQTFNAVMYLLSTGLPMALSSQGFSPQGTVRGYFDAWNRRGGWSVCMMCITNSAARKRGARPAPPPRSSTARA
jgi:transposase